MAKEQKEKPQVVTFHYPPQQVKKFVENWRAEMSKKKETTPEHLAVMSDILQLIDIAMGHLTAQPAKKQ